MTLVIFIVWIWGWGCLKPSLLFNSTYLSGCMTWENSHWTVQSHQVCFRISGYWLAHLAHALLVMAWPTLTGSVVEFPLQLAVVYCLCVCVCVPELAFCHTWKMNCTSGEKCVVRIDFDTHSPVSVTNVKVIHIKLDFGVNDREVLCFFIF